MRVYRHVYAFVIYIYNNKRWRFRRSTLMTQSLSIVASDVIVSYHVTSPYCHVIIMSYLQKAIRL